MDPVQQFIDITGAPLDTATYFLDLADFHLDNAIQLYYDEGDQRMNGGYVPATNYGSSENRDDLQNRTEDNRDDSMSSSSGSIQYYDNSYENNYSDEVMDDHSINSFLKSRNSLRKFYTIDDALRSARVNNRPLVINIFDSDNIETANKNKIIFENEVVVMLLSESYVFYQCSSDSNDGLIVKETYSIQSFPCLLVVDPKTGELMASFDGKLVDEFVIEFLTQYLHHELSQPSIQLMDYQIAPLPSDLSDFLDNPPSSSSGLLHRSSSSLNPSEPVLTKRPSLIRSLSQHHRSSVTISNSLLPSVEPISVTAPVEPPKSIKPPCPTIDPLTPPNAFVRFKIRDSSKSFPFSVPNTFTVANLFAFIWNTYYPENQTGITLRILNEKLDPSDTRQLKDTTYKNVVINVFENE